MPKDGTTYRELYVDQIREILEEEFSEDEVFEIANEIADTTMEFFNVSRKKQDRVVE